MKIQFKYNLVFSTVFALCWAYPAIAAEAPAYLRLDRAQAGWEAKNGGKTLAVEMETKQAIPMDGQSGAFGYAALSSDANNVLVLVTHLPIDDSSHEQTPSGFHTHVLDLKLPTTACRDATFEVDLESSGKNQAFDANYAWVVTGRQLKIKEVPASDLGDAGIENIVSFNLKPVLDAKGQPSNLCIYVADKL